MTKENQDFHLKSKELLKQETLQPVNFSCTWRTLPHYFIQPIQHASTRNIHNDNKVTKYSKAVIVTHNAECTNTFPIKSHVLRIALSSKQLASICNKHANRLGICVQTAASKTLRKNKY